MHSILSSKHIKLFYQSPHIVRIPLFIVVIFCEFLRSCWGLPMEACLFTGYNLWETRKLVKRSKARAVNAFLFSMSCLMLTLFLFQFSMAVNDFGVLGLYYLFLIFKIESAFPLQHDNLMIWACLGGTLLTQMTLRMSVIHSFHQLENPPPTMQVSGYTLLQKFYGPLMNAFCLSSLLIHTTWKAMISYQSHFHHFCFAWNVEYPFQMEFAVSNLNSSSFLVSWVQTSIKYKIQVLEYAVQVNEIFVDKVDPEERGFLLTDLEPNETYRVRIWCLTKPHGTWYPSRCMTVKTPQDSPLAHQECPFDSQSVCSNEDPCGFLDSPDDKKKHSISPSPSMDTLCTSEGKDSSEIELDKNVVLKEKQLTELRAQIRQLQSKLLEFSSSHSHKKNALKEQLAEERKKYEIFASQRAENINLIKRLENERKGLEAQLAHLDREIKEEKRRVQSLSSHSFQLNSELQGLKETRIQGFETVKVQNQRLKETVLELQGEEKKRCSQLEQLQELLKRKQEQVKDVKVCIAHICENIDTVKSQSRDLQCKSLESLVDQEWELEKEYQKWVKIFSDLEEERMELEGRKKTMQHLLMGFQSMEPSLLRQQTEFYSKLD